MSLYSFDSPQSNPAFVGYDDFGRPVYNRNARQKAFGLTGGLDSLSLGQMTSQTTTGGGGGIGGPLGAIQQAGQLAKNVRNAYEEGAPTQYGWGTEAGGLLNPTSYGSFGPPPADYSGPVFNSDWAAADAIDAGANGPWAAADAIDAGSGAAGAADAGGSLLGTAGEALPYIGAGLSLFDMATNGISGKNALGLASSVMPMIGMAGGPGVAAMTALIALGGGFDPTTPTQGVGGGAMIGPDGLWPELNLSDIGTNPATQAHFTEANRLKSMLAGVNLAPWAGNGVDLSFGSDADWGFDRPRYDAQLLVDHGDAMPFAGRFGVISADPNKVQQNFAQLAALGPQGAAGLPFEQLYSLLNADLSPEDLAAHFSVMRVEDR